MQLIGPEFGRLALSISWEEVRSFSGVPTVIMIQALVERYKFQFAPTPAKTWNELISTAQEFHDGMFFQGGKPIPIRSLVLYSDAVAVECRITDDAEAVMNDLVSWSQEVFSFRKFLNPPLKMYISQVVAKFDTPLESLFSRWRELEHLMLENLEPHYGSREPFGSHRIEFRSDPRKIVNAVLTSNIFFERRTNHDYPDNRYLCGAPLPTSQHIAFLERVEGLAQR